MLANEAGTGRGHIATLAVFAKALCIDHSVEAALCRLDHAPLLRAFCAEIYRGVALTYLARERKARRNRPIANWGEYLADIGFADQDFVEASLDWWVATLRGRRIDLLIAEFAPFALLAARALGIPSIATGQGHSVPPSTMARFPTSRSAMACLHDETELVCLVNRAGQKHGLPRLEAFPQIYTASAHMPRTIPQLDPYLFWRRNAAYLPPFSRQFPERGLGDEVFVYFSTHEHNEPAIMAAIAALGLPTRAVVTEASDEQREVLAQAGVVVETAPLPHAEIAARSRMIIHAGQHGAVCLGLALGLPQVAFPCMSEQSENARRIEALCTLKHFALPRTDVPELVHTIRGAYHDTTLCAEAKELSSLLRPVLLGDDTALIRGAARKALARRALA